MSLSGPYVRKTGREGSGDSQYTRTYTLPLEVISNDYNDDAVAVRAYVASFYPLGSGYGNDPGAVVQGYRETQQDDWQVWHVDVLYSSKIDIRASFGSSGGSGGSGGGGAQNADPLLRAPEISFSTETYQEAVVREFRRNANTPKVLRNSAKDPFFPPITIERRRQVMTYKVNKQTYDPLVFTRLLDKPTTNAELFLNFFTSETVHLIDHTADSLQENGIWYWVLTHKFRINVDRWNPVYILDQGFFHITATGAKVAAVGDDGKPATVPVLLDGDGGLYIDGVDPGDGVSLGFDLYELADYNVLE